ncbi:MAG: NAD+ synthase (glutamine-hydrolyzing) [Kiritimatiellia bacterium]|jgi:NAD+ synthase (glutamine-hydrolysing)
MSQLVIAMVQFNPTLGALDENTTRIILRAREAAELGAQVAVFPELAVSGYPPEDLILKEHFVEDCARQLNRLAGELPRNIICIVGCPTRGDKRARNSAVIFADGRMAGVYHKQLLPNYGVFDEQRVFEPGNREVCLQVGGFTLALHICEDSWYPEETTTGIREIGIHALINLSASPYARGKLDQRLSVLRTAAQLVKAPLLYTNLVGGQDELVFDGASLMIQGDTVVSRAGQFTEGLLLVALGDHAVAPVLSPAVEPDVDYIFIDKQLPSVDALVTNHTEVRALLGDLAEVYSALVLGLRDYVEKNGFKEAVVAISGGIDSALVAALAVDALGADRVLGVTMPSQYSSAGTLGDAGELAQNLGIAFKTVPIQHLVDTTLAELQTLWPDREADVTEENLQARIRGNIIMAVSNKLGHLVLATGNKSELATGYCTLYGDMCGGFAVIKDVPKTLVFDLCRWRNSAGDREVIPQSTIDRPPSAELRPDQKDSDSLPEYEVLDAILERYVERDLGRDAIVAEGYDAKVVSRVIRLVDLNEYKRRQGPPGVKITPKAFGKDRRMPITNRYREQD